MSALVVLAAAGYASAGPAPWDHQEQSSTPVHGTVRKVVVHVDSGNVVVRRAKASRVDETSRWFMTKPSVTVSLRNGVLTVEGHCPYFVSGPMVHAGDPLGACRTDVTVWLAATPRALSAETGIGSIGVTTVRGPTSLVSGLGDVTARDLAGPVKVSTGGGAADLSDVSAAGLSVSSGDGDTRLTRVRSSRPVTVTTNNGGVSVVALRASRVQVSTGSGQAQLVDVRVDDLTLRSTGGLTILSDSRVGVADVSSGTNEAQVNAVRARTRLTVRTDGGDARLDQVRSPQLSVSSSGGATALLRSAVGAATVRTDGGAFQVQGTTFTSLDAGASNGGVTMAVPGAFRRLVITTADGTVDVTVPAGAYALSLTSNGGQVRLDGVRQDPHARSAIAVSSGTGNITVHGR